MTRDQFIVADKTTMVDHLHERFGIPKGSARGRSKPRLIEQYDDCVRNEETHAAIARVASKPR